MPFAICKEPIQLKNVLNRTKQYNEYRPKTIKKHEISGLIIQKSIFRYQKQLIYMSISCISVKTFDLIDDFWCFIKPFQNLFLCLFGISNSFFE